jgi:hypothetical protein
MGSLRAHGLVLVVDDRLAVVGSLSLSPMHLAFRRELALTTADPAVLTSLRGFLKTLSGSKRAGRQVSAAAFRQRMGGAL